VEVPVKHRERALGDEGRRARDALVEHAAEGVEVRARVDEVAEEVLGRRVREGAREGASLERLAPRAGEELREAEVHEHHAAVVGEEDVLGLEIAVHHVARVERREAVAEGAEPREEAPPKREVGGLDGRLGHRVERFAEGVTCEELHREPRGRRVYAVTEHAHDAGVRHEAERVDLATEVREVRAGLGAHGLEGHEVPRRIARAVHDPHPAASDLAFESVRPDLHPPDELHG
jgi:hypothetical protein